MSYLDYLFEHGRLAVLRALSEAPANSANDSVLAIVLERLGLPMTRDQLRTQLSWLAEQGLIQLTHPTESLSVAVLRERGADVATGRAHIEGVQRPAPGR